MSKSPITTPTIFITAKDNNGDDRSLSISTWSKETGKPYCNILAHYRMKQQGRNISYRQVCGLDEIDFKNIESKKPPKRILSVKQKIVSEFLRKALV